MLQDLEIGDLVVVATQHGYSVAKVVRFLVNSNHAHRYVIQRVNLKEHEEMLEKDMKMSFLQAEIEEKAEEIRKRKELEALAKEDKELQELLGLVDELSN